MNICLVSQEYPPHTAKGGIGTQTYLKAHGLAALGHSVRVISRSPGARQHQYADGEVQVTRIPGMEAEFEVHTTLADWITYSAAVAAAVALSSAKAPIDLIDFPEWGCEGFVHLMNRSEWNHIPTVIHLHGPLVMFGHKIGWPEMDSEFYRTGTAMEAACVRSADRVFSSSDCSADWIARHYGLDRTTIPTLHTGIDTRLFRPVAGRKSDRPTVVFMGNLSMNKGVGVLADAMIRLAPAFPGLRLKLLGGGNPSLIAELQAQAATAGVPELFEFAGFVDRQQVPEHLAEADLFAAPSCYEGGPGFVYLEAMACGLPAIACSGSGSSEAITDGVTGLLVPPNDVAALTEALRKLLSNKEFCEQMGTAGRADVLRRADSRNCLLAIESFYAGVVSTARKSDPSNAKGES